MSGYINNAVYGMQYLLFRLLFEQTRKGTSVNLILKIENIIRLHGLIHVFKGINVGNYIYIHMLLDIEL